jgi:hypothetical protein
VTVVYVATVLDLDGVSKEKYESEGFVPEYVVLDGCRSYYEAAKHMIVGSGTYIRTLMLLNLYYKTPRIEWPLYSMGLEQGGDVIAIKCGDVVIAYIRTFQYASS